MSKVTAVFKKKNRNASTVFVLPMVAVIEKEKLAKEIFVQKQKRFNRIGKEEILDTKTMNFRGLL